MSWTTPGTAIAGEVLTAAFWNEQVRDNQNYLYMPPSVQVRRTTNLTSYTSNTAISWSGEEWDTDTMFSSGTDITIKTAGIYLLVLRGNASGSATITRILPRIFKGASEIAEMDANVQGGAAANFTITYVANLAVNDVITARVLFTGGSAYVISGNASDTAAQTALSVSWIGKA